MHDDQIIDVRVDEWNFKVTVRNPSEHGTNGWFWYVDDADTGKRLDHSNAETAWGARLAARRSIRRFVRRGGQPMIQTWFVNMKRSE